jgi:hypothetical protein
MFTIYWYNLIEILRETVMTNFTQKNLTSGTLKIMKS